MKQIVIGLVNVKGGVGKTSSAIHLASYLAAEGVEVWDADSQGTASEWADEAAESGEPLPFDVVPVNLPVIRKRQPTANITFIDSPPNNESLLNAIAERADIVIVPTAPTGADVQRVLSTVHSLPSGKLAIVLLTDANPNRVLYKETIAVLDEAGIAYFDEPIRTRETIKAAYGTNPKHFEGYAAVAEELKTILEEI